MTRSSKHVLHKTHIIVSERIQYKVGSITERVMTRGSKRVLHINSHYCFWKEHNITLVQSLNMLWYIVAQNVFCIKLALLFLKRTQHNVGSITECVMITPMLCCVLFKNNNASFYDCTTEHVMTRGSKRILQKNSHYIVSERTHHNVGSITERYDTRLKTCLE